MPRSSEILTSPLNCLPSRTYGAGRPHVRLCPIFLVFLYVDTFICLFVIWVGQRKTTCGCFCVEDDEDDEYNIRDPDWLKDIETAAALANLHDAVQLSTVYDDTGIYDCERLILSH